MEELVLPDYQHLRRTPMKEPKWPKKQQQQQQKVDNDWKRLKFRNWNHPDNEWDRVWPWFSQSELDTEQKEIEEQENPKLTAKPKRWWQCVETKFE